MALASAASADYFCTCDDKLFQKARLLPALSTLLGLVPEITQRSISIQPLHALNTRATKALVHELGIVDALRFLNQLRSGSGDYTTEREQLFKGESVESIASSIKSKRRGDR